MVDQTEPGSRPSHIVLFRQTGERPAQAMASVMSMQPAAGAPPHSRVTQMSTPGTEASAIYYRDLGVATISAAAEDIDRLRSLDEVEDVLVNEKRTIPTPVEGRRRDGTEPAG